MVGTTCSGFISCIPCLPVAETLAVYLVCVNAFNGKFIELYGVGNAALAKPLPNKD